jgi:predicted nucleic acid-binding Zn ribbon protein
VDERPPRPLGDALARVQRELGAIGPSELDAIERSWPELVGDALARHSRPVVLRGGVLRIVVDDPAWAGQFRYLAEGLLEALQERLPHATVREISVGGPGRGGGGRGGH